jgi:FKBP-type peptidyl-prolyl cis-trans isomerase FklB
MRKLKYILPSMLLFLFLAGLVSCGEDENTVEEYPNWKVTNDTYFKNLTDSVKRLIAAGDKSWKFFKTWSKDDSIKGKLTDSICVHVIQTGTGSGCPLYNDSVRVHFTGRLLPSTSYSEGLVIAQSYYGSYDPQTSVPTSYLVSNLVDGFTTAVMKMHIGDRWMVYMPYDLGYGSSESSTVPAYSTLIYDITLAAYYRVGVNVPDWTAKQNSWLDE